MFSRILTSIQRNILRKKNRVEKKRTGIKTEHKIFIITMTFGLLILIVDFFLDSLLFYKMGFTDLLILNTPIYKLYLKLGFMDKFSSTRLDILIFKTPIYKFAIRLIVLFFFITFGITMMRVTKKLRRAKEELNKNAEQINASLEEKNLLLKEIHHRVKNNMQVICSLLTLQSTFINDEKTSKIFTECQDRIRSMALVHDKLYRTKDFSRIDFREYIETLSENLFRSYNINKSKVSLNLNVQDIYLDIDTSIPCGLIINELVTNALKHAFKNGSQGKIEISLRDLNGNNQIELIVKDNGVGLPEDFDIKNTRSLGLNIVTLLAENQLHGTVKLHRENGTAFELILQKKGKLKEDKKHV